MIRWIYLAVLLAFGSQASGESAGWRPGSTQLALPELIEGKRRAAPVTEFLLSDAEIDRLLRSAPRESVRLDSVRLALNEGTTFRIRRVELYAPGVRPVATGSKATGRTHRLHFVGVGAEGAIGLSLDVETRAVTGVLSENHATHAITGRAVPGGVRLAVEAAPKDNDRQTMICETDGSSVETSRLAGKDATYPSLSLAPKGGTPLYLARIAVDTDNELLEDKFGNDAGAATAWIEDLFLALNVIYNRDLAMQLEIAALYLRTSQGNDPYQSSPPGNDYLGEFGAVWLDTPSLQAVDRQFALLLSGRNISPNSFSGVAWVDAYCRNTRRFSGSDFGSFSINRIGANLSPGFAAGGVGHEIGHNLGSFHTHCERLRSNGTEFVDQCFTESRGGCYDGPARCVADNVGSMMSYCHLNGISGCRNSDVFDPLIIGDLLSDDHIGGNYPSCIQDFVVAGGAEIFASGFEAGF